MSRRRLLVAVVLLVAYSLAMLEWAPPLWVAIVAGVALGVILHLILPSPLRRRR